MSIDSIKIAFYRYKIIKKAAKAAFLRYLDII